jgi:hypothetical protein
MKTFHAPSRACVSSFVLFIIPIISITALLFTNGCKDETITYSADDLTNPAVQPRVMFTLPENNSTGPFELFNNNDYYSKPHFIIRFNKLMDLSSIDLSLIKVVGFDKPVRVDLFRNYYYYPLEGKASRISKPSNAQYDNVLSFAIRDSFSYTAAPYGVGRSYIVVINPGLEDINGNKTSEQYRFAYKPEPYFRVLEIYPEAEPEDVSTTASISINFNSRIDNNIFSSLQISPSLEGQWKITGFDSSVAQFQKFNFLPFNSSFTISVLSSAQDSYGNTINHQESSLFSVAPFKVDATSPPGGSTSVRLDAQVGIGFTGMIDTSTVRTSIAISPSTQVVYYHYGTQTSFRPPIGFIPNTTYTISVSNTLHAYDGTILSAPYTFSFTTAPFQIYYTYPSDGAFYVDRNQSMYVSCNIWIDTGSVRSSFSINPPVSGNFSLYDGGNSFNFMPSSILAANTIYTVTISTSLRTQSGYNLQQPYTFRFKTGQ